MCIVDLNKSFDRVQCFDGSEEERNTRSFGRSMNVLYLICCGVMLLFIIMYIYVVKFCVIRLWHLIVHFFTAE